MSQIQINIMSLWLACIDWHAYSLTKIFNQWLKHLMIIIITIITPTISNAPWHGKTITRASWWCIRSLGLGVEKSVVYITAKIWLEIAETLVEVVAWEANAVVNSQLIVRLRRVGPCLVADCSFNNKRLRLVFSTHVYWSNWQVQSKITNKKTCRKQDSVS